MNAPVQIRAGLRDPFSAFLNDGASEDVARAVGGEFGWPLERIHDGGVRYAVQTLAVSASPSILLIDLSESSDPLEDINGLAEVCEPGTMVIACGQANDVQLYRKLIAHGIHDYLVKPFSAEQLRDAILDAQAVAAGARGADQASETPHLMTAVIGVRGGVGCSTLAASVAWMYADAQHSTALLDLDVHFGTGALAYDIEPGRGLTDAIENPGRIDGLFIERALVRVNDKLGVLSAEAPISQPLAGDGSAFFQLQDELRAASERTVLDLPRHMLVQHPSLLHDIACVIVVTELTLAATRDTIRILSWLKANAPGARIVLVANKVPPAGSEEISRKDFEASVERKVDLALPLDPKLTGQAAKQGKPLAAVKSAKFGQSFTALRGLIAGETAEGAPSTGTSLIGRFKDVGGLLRKKAK